MELKAAKIFLALPSYDGQRINAGALIDASNAAQVLALEIKTSLLANGFNKLLCWARACRAEDKATHFLMLHADIRPTADNWLQILWQEFHDRDAELMSAVVPIKSDEGHTSTAIESDDPWLPERLSMAAVLQACPGRGSFEHPGLLLNTGLMLFDLRAPWVDACHFEIRDRIAMLDGVATPQCIPEDWGFTRQARAAGCKRIFATTAVPLEHHGNKAYVLAAP